MNATRIPFVKMNGLGNEIIIADVRGRGERVTSQAAIALAKPDAIPFDQMMEVANPQGSGRDFDIRIFNADGSFAESCGNGTRCVAQWLNAEDGRTAYNLLTGGGLVTATMQAGGMVAVNMGRPRFGWQDIPLSEEFSDTTGIELQIGPIDAPVLHTPSVVNMGNPHVIFWAPNDVWTYDLARFGPLLENHPLFPQRANVTIANVVSPNHIVMRTWERGAGLTKACGSAACATLVAAARKGLTDRSAVMTLPGGDLHIEWEADGNVKMTGPAQFEFAGLLDPHTGAFERNLAEGSAE